MPLDCADQETAEGADAQWYLIVEQDFGDADNCGAED
jgi:hypothetical protein